MVPQRPRALGRAPGWVELVALAAAGALQTLAFIYTAHWWLPLLTTALLVWRLNGATPGRGALLAWVYGTAWLAAGTWWLFISLHRYGGLPAGMAVVAVAALAAALSLYLALAGGLYARWRRGVVWHDAPLFAALWLLAEGARQVIFTGFPWVASGYSQVDAPLAVSAPFVGVMGMGALLALLAAVLGNLGQIRPGRRWVASASVSTALGVPALLGAPDFTRPAGEISVALIQTRVQQDEKFKPERLPETLSWLAAALLQAEADLVVTPETAVPLLPEQLAQFAPGYWDALVTHFTAPGRAALVGIPLGDFDVGFTNSVVGLAAPPATPAGASGAAPRAAPGIASGVASDAAPDAAPYRYDKLHLVPFGEFVPPGFRWFTRMMNIPLGDFARGVPNPPSFAVQDQRVGPNICYEDLFGEELAARFIAPAQAPTLLANVSNIAWFGDSIAIPQHLQISRLRTLELQRPMVRATNTGPTAIIDHRGVVTAALPGTVRGVLQGRVGGRDGITPYAAWAARWGHAPLWLGAVAVLAGLAVRRRSVDRRSVDTRSIDNSADGGIDRRAAP